LHREEDDVDARDHATLSGGVLRRSLLQPRLVGRALLTGWYAVPGDKESLPTLRARFLPLATRMRLWAVFERPEVGDVAGWLGNCIASAIDDDDPELIDNVWLAGRRQEHDALGRIIVSLERARLADGTVHAIRGGGVGARTDALIDKGANA
jgi:hypothetical protein